LTGLIVDWLRGEAPNARLLKLLLGLLLE